MANTVAGLAVSLGLNATEYFRGLTKAEYEAKKFASNFDRGMSSVRSTLKTIGIGVVVEEMVRGLYNATKTIISTAAELSDFADQTGSTVEALSKLSNQAAIAGTPFEELQSAVLKLSIGMGGVDKKSQQVQATLKILGVTAKDPAEAMQQIAVAFAKYEDGATKAAYANILFAKSGAKFLATLADMAKLQDVVGTTTTEQAKNAEALIQAYNRISAEATTFKNAILINVVPPLLEAITTFNEARKAGLGFWEALNLIGSGQVPLADRIAAAEEKVKDLDKAVSNFGMHPKAMIPTPFWFNAEDLAKAKKELQALQNVAFAQNKQNAFRGNDVLQQLPKPPGGRGGKGTDQTGDLLRLAKQQLDSQLSAQEDFMRAEQALLREREQFLQSYYRDDLISLENYYAGRQHAAEQATANTIAAINKEIEAQRAFAKQAETILAKDPEKREASRIQTETAIAKLVAERGRVEHDAAVKTADAKGDLTRAQQQYTDSINETNAAVLQMMGNERKAAEIRLEIQNRSAIAKATLAGDAATVANIRALEKQALAQVDLNVAATEYQKTMESLSIAQARIALAEAAGNITTLEAMARRQQAVEKHIGQLREQIAIQERIAETLVGPAYDEAIAKIQRMKLEIDVLAQSANELENAFRKTFEDAFADNFASVIDGTKSVKQAFKDMANDILGDLTRMASRNIAQTIFGTGGAGSGLPGILAGVFGYGGGGGGMTAPGIAGGTIGFAAGGQPPMGRISVVGERGPELFVPRTPGTIVPMNKAESMLRGNYVFNINVPAGATRSTIDQTRVKFGLELQNALDRGS